MGNLDKDFCVSTLWKLVFECVIIYASDEFSYDVLLVVYLQANLLNFHCLLVG